MKLRQKLAAVLAATMVVTAVPVVTMAASDAYVQKVQQVLENNKEDDFNATLVIDLKDAVTTGGELVYLELKGAEFVPNDKATTFKDGSIEEITKDEMTVKINEKVDGKVQITLPINKLTDDKAVIMINGTNVVSSSNKDGIVIATVADQKALVTAAESKTIYDGGEVANITIDEQVAKTFKAGDLITVELDNSDFKFTEGKAKSGRGLLGTDLQTKVTDDELQITVPSTFTGTTQIGRITIEGIKLDLTHGVKKPSFDDVKVTVRSKEGSFSDQTVKVAEVKDYATTFAITKAADMVAGKDAEVEVVLKETIKGETFRPGKTVQFTLSEGFFMSNSNISDSELTKVKYYDEDDKQVDPSKKEDATKAVTMEAEVAANAKEEIKFNVKVGTELGAKEDVMMKVSGRGLSIDKEEEQKVATVKAPFEVKVEKAVVKAGLNKQKAGKITLVETEKGKIDDITIKIDAEDAGITFADKPVVEGTNIKLGTMTQVKTTSSELNVTVPVTRSSKETGTIEIKELPVNVSRMAPEGSWDAKISMNGYHGSITVEDFLTIGTPNVEDLASNGLKKGTTSFVINSTKCIVNGVEKTLDAAPYVSAKNRTMIPVRALADAFGVDSKDIMFSNGTIVIIAGNKTVQLKNGSDIASVNGVQMKMDEKVTIKNNRAYAPASQIGNLLGVEPTWDGATQTATFTNK